MSQTALEKIEHEEAGPPAIRGGLPQPQMSVEDLVRHVNFVEQVADEVMQDGVHYGQIPGTPRPSLWKPGAQKLGLAFHFAPKYTYLRQDLEGGHREYEVTCDLYKRGSMDFVGSGVGSASTLEARHRYRNARLTCPSCGREAIVKSKPPYKGFWCALYKDGCKAQFGEDDPRIRDQETGRVENPDLADTYNAVFKAAAKRAYIEAMITATATGDRFTQEIVDEPEEHGTETTEKPPERDQEGPNRSKKEKPDKPPAQALNQQKAAIKRLITQHQPEGTTWQQAMEWMRLFVGVDINGLDEEKARIVLKDLEKGERSTLTDYFKNLS